MNWSERGIIAVIVGIFIFVFFGYKVNGDEFKQVCADSGGTTVWDGRQYQCLKPIK
tara:strand:+ start:660 stop:827 length:168 start_codon:yes stop_codon:yes gene_type:complete